jgi:hypothetical protein
MLPEQQERLQEQLAVCTLGSVRPMPQEYCLQVENAYSKQDFAALSFAWPHLLGSKCQANFVSCKSSWKERSAGVVDHAFLGTTYQRALENNIKSLRKKHAFYDGKSR